MAHFLRGKQAGIQKDFSGTLAPELFDIDDVCLNPLRHQFFLSSKPFTNNLLAWYSSRGVA
jgi:hypothetical protein